VYSNGNRYRPKPEGERTYAVRRPADPRAVRFHGGWYLPLEVLPLNRRYLPMTRPDSEAYDHMPRPCRCDVCSRPAEAVGRWQRKWRKDHGLKP
jgi:hypothetical protein